MLDEHEETVNGIRSHICCTPIPNLEQSDSSSDNRTDSQSYVVEKCSTLPPWRPLAQETSRKRVKTLNECSCI